MSRTTDDFNPLSFGEPHHINTEQHDVLRDFSDFWGSDGMMHDSMSSPMKETVALARGSSNTSRMTFHHHRNPSVGESATQVSETETSSLQRYTSNVSCTSSNRGEYDYLSAVSNDTDDASRSSVKRRRTVCNLGFQPLARVRETGAPVTQDDEDVRPWMVEVKDHDVVLGDTHEPTWGTRVYREIRKPYAKKTLDNEQLKHVKTEFQRRLEKQLKHKLKCPPTFWVNQDNTSKSKQSQVSGYLKNRPGITYKYAKDQAIKDDIKNASARSRTRSTKVFTCKGTLTEAIEKAILITEEWVGDDVDKELYARNFREDLKRLAPWHGFYVEKKHDCENRARMEPEMKGTHMREARIHETHASHLETSMVDMINQMGNLMVESHRNANKKSSSATIKSSGSVDGSASYASSKDPVSSRSKPPLGMRSVPEHATSGPRRGGISARPRVNRRSIRDDEHGTVTVSSSTFSGAHSHATTEADRGTLEEDGVDSVEMDVSPVSVRKAMLTENLGQTFVMPSAAENEKSAKKKELEAMFNTLRMGTGDDVPREVDQEAPDELSVLSMPDDVSVLLEARELAIRRGIDQPAALPRPGHVATMLQQLGSKGKKEG